MNVLLTIVAPGFFDVVMLMLTPLPAICAFAKPIGSFALAALSLSSSAIVVLMVLMGSLISLPGIELMDLIVSVSPMFCFGFMASSFIFSIPENRNCTSFLSS
ncbi:hypothetical protein [Pedobacter sp. Hv1]|uniref:hypothetical protein n=1 Tax=Pedobacter sp. Hv1 TaxID=1740090 RepID=UPI0006D8A443|nr:hypothetical protein [Pedobacter sp. Hv1]KQB98936.1 hypothetical protein AQF98_19600 [Pedobacter sp. Hv1]